MSELPDLTVYLDAWERRVLGHTLLAVRRKSPFKKRASLHRVAGEAGLAARDPGGVEPLLIDEAAFATALRRGNHTLERALTDPRILAGICNA